MLRKRNRACHFNCAFNNRAQETRMFGAVTCMLVIAGLKIAFLVPEFHCTSLHNKTFKMNTAAHLRFRPRKRPRDGRTIDGFKFPTYFNLIKLFRKCFLFLTSFVSFLFMLGNHWMKKFVLLKEIERRFNNVEVIFCHGEHSAKPRDKKQRLNPTYFATILELYWFQII